MNQKRRHWTIPFLDLSNVLFFFFVGLFALALLVISDDSSKAKVDTTSHYLITLKWPDGSPNDIDLSIRTPAGNVAWFRKREADFSSLDHDNLGIGNTSAIDELGNTVSMATRDEVIYIRQAVLGTYTVNVHYYSGDNQAVPVIVTMTSIDPVYHQVIARSLTLTEKHEELTAFQFTINKTGAVESTNTNTEELFINEMLATKSGASQ